MTHCTELKTSFSDNVISARLGGKKMVLAVFILFIIKEDNHAKVCYARTLIKHGYFCHALQLLLAILGIKKTIFHHNSLSEKHHYYYY